MLDVTVVLLQMMRPEEQALRPEYLAVPGHLSRPYRCHGIMAISVYHGGVGISSPIAIIGFRKVSHERLDRTIARAGDLGLPSGIVGIPQFRLPRDQETGNSPTIVGVFLDCLWIEVRHQHRDGVLHGGIRLDLMSFKIFETLADGALGIEVAAARRP